MSKLYIYAAVIFLLIASCEEETLWNISSGKRFVVCDCIITNEFKNQELRIYWSGDTLNQPPEGYSGARPVVSDGISEYPFSEDPLNKGKYVSDVRFRATAGKTYMLTVACEGSSDTAYASARGVVPLETMNITPSGDYFRYNIDNSNPGYMLEVFYNWSEVPDYCDSYGSCAAMDVWYVVGNIDLGKIFAADRQVIVFPRNTTIIRRKYSLSLEHQEFARSLMLETEWRGGIFDAEAGNVLTNFRNGMQGWFGACTVVSDTSYFK